MIQLNVIDAPTIEIKFGNCSQTNAEILSIYVRTVKDAVLTARGDYEALDNLYRLFTEARYVVKELRGEAYWKRCEVQS